MLALVYEVFYFVIALVLCVIILQLVSVYSGFGCDDNNLFAHSSSKLEKGQSKVEFEDTFHFTKELVVEIPSALTDIPRAIVYQVIDKSKLLGGVPIVGDEKFQVPGTNAVQRLRWKFSHLLFKPFASDAMTPDRHAFERFYDVRTFPKLGCPKGRTLVSKFIKFLPSLL